MPEKVTVEDQVAYYTQKLGDLSRQLGFAGLALAWLFHSAATPQGAQATATALDASLKTPLTLIVISLAIDALQYIVGSLLWTKAYFKNPEAVVQDHPRIAGFNLFVSISKTIIMAVAYCFLVSFVANSPMWK